MPASSARHPQRPGVQQRPVSRATTWFATLPAWTGDVLAVVVVLVVSFLGGPMGPGRPVGGAPGFPGEFGEPIRPLAPLVVPLVTALIACGLIPLRRRWPLTTLIISIVLYCSTVFVHEPSLGVGIVVILASYAVGARRFRRLSLIIGGCATVFFVVLSLTSSEFGVVDVRVFQLAAGIAVAIALGDSSRSHREFVAAATERAERAEQSREAEAQKRVAQERLHIAQDLHDTVAHQISVISLNAGAASQALAANPEKVRQSLHTIRSSSREVLTEIGKLLTYLRADGEAGATAPQPSASDIPTLVARVQDTGLAVSFTSAGPWEQASEAAGRVLYRVIQETLTNAHKHGSEGRATVELRVEGGEVVATISNPVSRTNRNQPESASGGLGLTGIRERVASLGGSVTIEVNERFTLEARLPYK